MKFRVFLCILTAVVLVAGAVGAVVFMGKMAQIPPQGQTDSVTTGAPTIDYTTVPSEKPTEPAGPGPVEPPVTQPPVTEPPITEPPVTEPLPTDPPPTEPPATDPPVTKPPVTDPPVSGEKVFPKLTAKTAFVFDTRTDSYLYLGKSETTSLYPASITKLFNTYVALRYLQPSAVITVGDELDYLQDGASVAGLKKGDRITVEATVKCALLPSGCDASYVLAAAAGRVILEDETAGVEEAIQAFMDRVNEVAQQLGMTGTYLVTPDGTHHANHKISISGLVTIAKCCMEDPVISEVTRLVNAQVSVINSQGVSRTIKLKNTNSNLNPKSEFYTASCVGLKTGYTSKAGVCLLGVYQVEDGYLIIGLFGCPTLDSRYVDALALLNYYAE
jgi:D-alanyl-D-alanine carboxypeptidase (penicillin-binding protein 5/6)